MAVVNPTQSNSGDTIEADDINTPVNQLAAEINGNIETANLKDSAVTTAKITDDAVTDNKLDYPRWWQEIGRTTLSGSADSISVASLPARKFLKIIITTIASGSVSTLLRFNNDSAANYAFRVDSNGTGSSGVSQTSLFLDGASATSTYASAEVINVAAQEKLVTSISMSKGTAGAGNAPSLRVGAGKWANTADQITRVDVVNTDAGDYLAGSEVIVLGHD
ncbi:MAG TPA: hypothetical protein VJ836_00825 [Candidatus Saccharimonadales bacterium]|nr:hypothetical protein [Candidatus Saccharimonadales bacterium]